MGLHADLLVILVCFHILFHNRVRCHMETTNPPGTYLAIARTKASGDKYFGAESFMTLHKLKLSGQQFSATRIRMGSGSDSIEAGWRVDPGLYRDGNSGTHFFVRTDAGSSHCFNTLCPGFVHTNLPHLFDGYFHNLSKPGGPIYHTFVQILWDNTNGKWNLIAGGQNVGYWHPSIFGHTGFADYIEWGAAAYAPPGSPLPPMGFSNFPIGHPLYDAHIDNVRFINEKGQSVDADNLETYSTDPSLYIVSDAGKPDKQTGRLIVYGGSGHRKN